MFIIRVNYTFAHIKRHTLLFVLLNAIFKSPFYNIFCWYLISCIGWIVLSSVKHQFILEQYYAKFLDFTHISTHLYVYVINIAMLFSSSSSTKCKLITEPQQNLKRTSSLPKKSCHVIVYSFKEIGNNGECVFCFCFVFVWEIQINFHE